MPRISPCSIFDYFSTYQKLLCQGNIYVICFKVYMYIPAVNEMHFVIV